MWLEPLVLPTRLAHADGRLVAPLDVLPIDRPLRIGRRGQGTELEWELGRTLVVTPKKGAVELKWEDSPRSRTLQPGEVWSDQGISSSSLRVLASPSTRCAWPDEHPAPIGPWSDDLLSVLGDSLLETGHPVGTRLTHRIGDDASWLPLIPLWPRPCVDLTWRRGVVDALTLRTFGLRQHEIELFTLTWPLGRSLARHALLKPLRSLALSADVPQRDDLLRFVAGLVADQGLPCLERMVVQLRGPLASPALRHAFAAELRALPGLTVGFPTLSHLAVEGDPTMSPERKVV